MIKTRLLTETTELADILDSPNLRIIDTRPENIYFKSHICGAINIPDIFTYLCEDVNGGVPAMVAFFRNTFSKSGIKPDDQVVIYEDTLDNGYGQSCRGWFLFNLLGHLGNVSVLHGGFKAWVRNEFPIDSNIPIVQTTQYNTQENLNLLITKKEMLLAINDPSVQIVDVRDYAEWVGANSSPYGYDFCPRKGRIPNAKWLEWYKVMTRVKGIPYFKSNEEIIDLVDEAGIPQGKPLILYCFKGARTSNVMLALTKAGYSVKNYFNSWNEWSRDPSLPIDESYPLETE